MAEIMGKGPSGHGEPTRIKLLDGCGGETTTTVVLFGYDMTMCLKATWEMSVKKAFNSVGLKIERRDRLEETLPAEPDGRIHLIARAWAVRGTVPG